MKPPLPRRHLWLASQALCCASFFVPASAATFDNPTPEADYATGANWSTSSVPSGTESATIGNGGNTRSATYQSATGFVTTGNLILGTGAGSNGTLTLSGSADSLSYNGIDIGASGGTGSLLINAGAVTTSGAINIATSGGLTSSLTIHGGTLNIGNHLIVPDANVTGTVNLNAGFMNLGKSLVFGGGGVTSSSGIGILNLNGGTLSIGAGDFGGSNSITRYGTAGLYRFNFNGGTLKTTAAAPNLLGNSGTVAGTITYNVQPGGAIIDTTGGDATASATLVASAANGGLTKNGANTLTFSGIASGNPLNLTANGGSLRLARTGLAYNNTGGSANLGVLTVKSGATLQISGAYNIGYQQAVNIQGGTLDLSNNVTSDGQNYTLNLNFNDGGSIVSTTGSSLRWGELANAAITVNGTTPATISSILRMIPGNGRNGTIHVADAAGNLDFTGNIVDYPGIPGGVPLIKTGDGMLTLGGTNNYTSTTTVNGGTLRVTGSTGPSAVTVNNGGSLSGSGTIGGPVTVQSGGTLTGTPTINGLINVTGTIAPGGTSIATLTVNNTLNLQSGSSTAMQISKTDGVVTNDQLSANTVNYGGTLVITAAGEPLAPGDSFTLFDALARNSTFTAFTLPALASGLSWDVSGLNATGSIQVVDTLPTPVFSPPTGGFIGAQNITITCNEPGATIYYTFTTNGNPPPDPTVLSNSGIAGSSVAAVNVPIDSLKSIKAIAVRAGSANSPVALAEYATVITPAWTLDGSGSWSDPSNWFRGAIAQGSGVPADFGTLMLTAPGTVILNDSRTIGSLKFADTGDTYGWMLDATGGSVLTLDGGGSTPVITVANQSATISASLTGGQGMIKNGLGTLTLSGANSYGSTLVQSGALIANSALPAGQPIMISPGAALNVNSIGAQYNWYKLVTSTSIGAGGQLTLAGSATEIHNLTLTGGSLGGSSPDANYGTWGFNTPTAVEPIVVTGGATSTISANRFDSAWGNPLTLQVDAGSTLQVTGIIGGNPGHDPFGVTKTGTGTAIFSAVNAYTGTTTVSSGTLILGTNDVLANTSGVSIDAAILATAAAISDTVGTLDITGTATLDLGAGATLSFADSSALDWAGGTLNLTGSFVSGASLRFGTTNLGLTTAQLALISAPGITSFSLDSDGYLISGGTYNSWAITNGVPGQAANLDHDQDGVSNGVEYFLGGPTGNTTGFTALPSATATGGSVSIIWTKATSYTGSYGTDFLVESSDSLTGDWQPESASPTPGATVTITGDEVKFTFPAGTRKFARLKLMIP